jgi:hypothetical protein
LAKINNKTKRDIKIKALTLQMSRTLCVQVPDVEPTIWSSLTAAPAAEAKSPSPKQGNFLRKGLLMKEKRSKNQVNTILIRRVLST